MTKLAREHRLRERRLDKQARRDARKAAAENPEAPEGALDESSEELADSEPEALAPEQPASD